MTGEFPTLFFIKFDQLTNISCNIFSVFPVLDALDPNGFIMYRLVRDATHFVDGHHVKSLDRLNRDLSKVIVVDWNPNSTKFHPENSFNIPRWSGNDDDTALFDLAAFLKSELLNNLGFSSKFIISRYF